MDAETQLQKLVTQMNAILAKLNAEQQRISDYLLQEEPPFWAFEDASRETVASFITDLEYRDDKAEGGSTTSLPAAIPLHEKLCRHVELANEFRTELVEFLREMDKQYTDGGLSLSKYLMEKVQLRRLNRKAVARQYLVLDRMPQSISFMWSKSTTTQKLARDQAVAVVNRRINSEIDKNTLLLLIEEKEQLLKLPDDEILARVYTPTPQPKVNIIIDNERMPVKTAHLPLFYPAEPNEPLPVIIPPGPQFAERPRLKRNDTRLESEPLCPLTRIYRYKPMPIEDD